MKKKKLLKKINKKFLLGIAHRGLHNDEFTENGLKAFQNAIDHDIAFELDVHLSKDGKLVVCHDDNLIRTTGKDGIIEELTVEEIKNSYKLLDGEEVPLLKEVLELNNEKVPLVIELKVRNNNYKELGRTLINELKEIKDRKNFNLISFDPRALLYARKTRIINSLLVCKEHWWTFKLRYFFNSLDLDSAKIKDDKVKKYQKNHFVNVWTIENESDLNDVYKYSDTVTFQYINPKLVKEKLKSKQ